MIEPAVHRAPPQPWRWDLFCRVIDNFGDIGVAWRLAADLAARGQPVRLWLDDPAALRWMAPHGAPGVDVRRWVEPWANAATPGDVVVELFGCDPPAAFVARMAQGARAPVWINLEYLSAESYVERSHGLASPQFSGPGQGLTKWFFYPGFTARTGGLLREPDLNAQQMAFKKRQFLSTINIHAEEDEHVVSLFVYAAAPVLPVLAAVLARRRTLLLVPPGAAGDALQRAPAALQTTLNARIARLPWLTQINFDRLLWACDLNLVRGEDSFVRAQWAGQPFLWQIYPQHDGVHARKLEAFLQRYLYSMATAGTNSNINDDDGDDGTGDLARTVGGAMRRLNGLAEGAAQGAAGNTPAAAADWLVWRAHAQRWRAALQHQSDLTTRLLAFVGEKL